MQGNCAGRCRAVPPIDRRHVWVGRGQWVALVGLGPAWIGAGRTVPAGTTVIGPAVVWDDPARRPSNDVISWLKIEPRDIPAEPEYRDGSLLGKATKFEARDGRF